MMAHADMHDTDNIMKNMHEEAQKRLDGATQSKTHPTGTMKRPYVEDIHESRKLLSRQKGGTNVRSEQTEYVPVAPSTRLPSQHAATSHQHGDTQAETSFPTDSSR